jgi:hypothetical protein
MRPVRSVSVIPSTVPSIRLRISVAFRAISSSPSFCSVTSTMKPCRYDRGPSVTYADESRTQIARLSGRTSR